ncbi:MAG TPA: polysaccharide biosynthesis C-terminal domain-containing protein [Chryseosolibacter sp.]
MGKLKRLAGETILYGFGSIIPRFLNFLLVRLHTAVFVPEEYGIITKLFAYVAVINTIFMFGMETAYFRFANKEGADEKRIFNITQTVVLIISGLCSILLIAFAQPVASYLDIPSRPDLVIWLVVLMFIDAAVAIPFAQLRFYKKALTFAAGKILNVAILVFLNVFFLKLMNGDGSADVGFVVLANLIANAFYILLLAPTLWRWRPAFDKQITPAVFEYSFPIMLTGLAGITNEMFSRITLERWLPEGFYGKSTDYALGIFGAAYKFAVLMNLAIQGFRYAAEPFFFSNASEKNSPQLFAKINHYFVIVCCLLLLSVSINLDILKHFLAKPEYWEGLYIVPILLLAYLFLGVYYNFSVWFKLSDRTYYGTFITILGAIITIVANYVLIPMAGYEGSAWAALICYFVMTMLCYALGKKFYPIPYDLTKMFGYIIVTTLLCYGVNKIEIPNQWLATGFHIAVILAWIAIVYLIERKNLVTKRA